MADGIKIDASELNTLAADLSEAGNSIVEKVTPAMSRGALNIKKQMQAEMGGSSHFGMIAPTIDYDLNTTSSLIGAEVGPNKTRTVGRGRPGPLANIAYFGTSRGGGTVPDPQGALDAELPRFAQALGEILDGLI